MQMQRFVVTAALGLSLALPSLAAPQNSAPPPPPPPGFMLLDGPGAAIGASIRDVDRLEAERLKMDGGAFVDAVRMNSPAEKAGLRAADVIVQFDGERVRSARHLTRLVRETPPGRTVKAVVLRSDKRVEVSVTPEGDAQRVGAFDPDRLREQLGRMSDRWFDDGLPGSRARLGATVEELTPQLAAYFGAKQGVLVAAVADNSPASRAGLAVGDVIISIDSRPINSRADLVRAFREAKDGQDVKIGIVRDKRESSVTAKVERWNRRKENV